jgi:zinc transporter ZupT
MGSDPHGLQILAISVAALLLGPGIHRVARREKVTMAALDNFVLVAVAGLVMVEIVPTALAHAGPSAFLALVLGILGPSIAEGPLRLAARGTHGTALTVAVLGMAAHSFTDGLALASAHLAGSSGHALEVAVIAHQLPVAVAVWWLLSPLGLLRASSAMVLLGVATIAGFVFADSSLSAIPESYNGLFQALVGGLLLHVVAHRSARHDEHEHGHDHDHGHRPEPPPSTRVRVAASLGGLAGLGLLALLARQSDHGHDGHAGESAPLTQVLAALTDLTRDSAPALLLAFVLAGLVATLLPEAPLRWLRRGSSLAQAARGVAFGLPLPLCSCGVVPVYRSLLQRGVPAAAAMAFLVATPELGIDAVLLSIPLLGGTMTAARVFGAVLVALLVGWLVGGLADRLRPASNLSEKPADPRPLGERLRDGVFRVGLVEMVDATAPWIVFGLVDRPRHRRSLPHRRAARRGRHGGGVRRRAPQAAQAGRVQDDPAEFAANRRRRPASPARRWRPRRSTTRTSSARSTSATCPRAAVPGDPAGPRREPRPEAARTAAAAVAAGVSSSGPDRRRAGGRARGRHRPPRPQARQHPARAAQRGSMHARVVDFGIARVSEETARWSTSQPLTRPAR